MPLPVSRRAFVQLAASGLAAGVSSCRLPMTQPAMPAATAVDHLLLGVADLDAGIGWVEQRTGVRAVVGGVHPGRGTRNALIALSGRQDLEILAPDPTQERGGRADLRGLGEPRLITWAALATDIGGLAARVKAAGLNATGPRAGSRARPDGASSSDPELRVTLQLPGRIDITFRRRTALPPAGPRERRGCARSFDLPRPHHPYEMSRHFRKGVPHRIGRAGGIVTGGGDPSHLSVRRVSGRLEVELENELNYARGADG